MRHVLRPLTAILPARTGGDFEAALRLVREHARWPESSIDAGPDEREPSWAQELDDLAAVYTPPRGELLLARVDGSPVGTAGVRVDAYRRAELRRMYVAPAGRGLGLRASLLDAALASARALGARIVWLETSRRIMGRAIEVYEARGFVPGPASELGDPPDAVTMRLLLDA